MKWSLILSDFSSKIVNCAALVYHVPDTFSNLIYQTNATIGGSRNDIFSLIELCHDVSSLFLKEEPHKLNFSWEMLWRLSPVYLRCHYLPSISWWQSEQNFEGKKFLTCCWTSRDVWRLGCFNMFVKYWEAVRVRPYCVVDLGWQNRWFHMLTEKIQGRTSRKTWKSRHEIRFGKVAISFHEPILGWVWNTLLIDENDRESHISIPISHYCLWLRLLKLLFLWYALI